MILFEMNETVNLPGSFRAERQQMKNIIPKRNIPSDILIFAVAKIKSAPDVAEG